MNACGRAILARKRPRPASARAAERRSRSALRRNAVGISWKELALLSRRGTHDHQSTCDSSAPERALQRSLSQPRLCAQSRGPVKIGAFGPMSGNAAAQGQSVREAVELVVNLKNSAGGLLGRPIELVIGDDAGKPEEAAVVARRFATRDQVVLAIGSVSSPASLAAAQVFREEELPQIVVSGTAQRITTQGNEWVFRRPCRTASSSATWSISSTRRCPSSSASASSTSTMTSARAGSMPSTRRARSTG